MACSTEETPPPAPQDSGPRPDTQVLPDTTTDGVIAAPDDAVHVSPTGFDGDSCGAKESPCQTISQGVARASIYQPQRPVAITGGIYSETVRLASGVHLLGGFNDSFIKDGTGNTSTIIRGLVTAGEAVALIAEDLNTETRVESVEIEAPQAVGAGKSSYGVVVRNAPLLKIRGCVIRASNGTPGVHGTSHTTPAAGGQPGQPGEAGGNYPVSNEFPFLPIPPSCALAERHLGGPGGAAVSQNGVQCIGAGGTGGASGVDTCAGYDGGSATVGDAVAVCNSRTFGLGGIGGAGGVLDETTCVAISQGAIGLDGCPGKDGTPGTDGAAGTARVVGSYWTPTDGEAGGSGLNDTTGGGGGGGGGGGECKYKCITSGGGCASDFGGSGGGGGSAGCFGRGGDGGSSAGGSFGVLIADGSSHIEIANSTIITGQGGAGGNGGSGQPGGPGGAGSNGGADFQDGAAGGKGGKGGMGGSGGAGGGGAGGPSVGVYVAAGASPSLANNTFTLGQSGPGGMAGRPDGNHGAAGVRQEIVTP